MKWRYSFVFVCFFFAFLGIWGKLFYYQVVLAQELSNMGTAQSAINLEIPPIRGEIKAADGFPLVSNKISYLLYANPTQVKDIDSLSHILSPFVQVDSASISAQLQLKKVWVPLAIGISDATKKQVELLNLPGLGFEQRSARFYPEASMAAQLVGFVGKDNLGNDKGYFGIEGYYDLQLKGRIGKTTVIRDAFGKPVLAKLTDNSGQQDGRTLTLSINRAIQFAVEKKLKAGIEKYGAQSGMVAVMNPKTGELLALSSFPSFDPQKFWEFDTSSYRNSFISDTYEPGSTFKPLIMSGALDKELISPISTCPICDKPVQIGDYEIKTWNDKYFPNTNMIDIMIHSDNTGMVYIAKKLGLDGMLDVLQKFGFGSTTGVDLQGEFSPELRLRDAWYPIDVATAGFGQGIAVTPLQLLSAFSAIANNGVRMQPHVVTSIQTSNGETIAIDPKELSQPISQKTAKVMTEMLVTTVEKGEASFARLKGYRIAGKTGTASIPVSGHYDPTKTIASFIGFAPADDPKFVMIVILNQPTSSIYGAETAAPIFFDISQNILDYYGITPTQ